MIRNVSCSYQYYYGIKFSFMELLKRFENLEFYFAEIMYIQYWRFVCKIWQKSLQNVFFVYILQTKHNILKLYGINITCKIYFLNNVYDIRLIKTFFIIKWNMLCACYYKIKITLFPSYSGFSYYNGGVLP